MSCQCVKITPKQYETAKAEFSRFLKQTDDATRFIVEKIKEYILDRLTGVDGKFTRDFYTFKTRDITRRIVSSKTNPCYISNPRRKLSFVAEHLKRHGFLEKKDESTEGKDSQYIITPIGIKFFLNEIGLGRIRKLYDIDSTYILGRDEEIAEVEEKLQLKSTKVNYDHFVIKGESGIGKSTIIRNIYYSNKYNGNVLYLNFQNIQEDNFGDEIQKQIKETFKKFPDDWKNQITDFTNLNEFISVLSDRHANNISHFFVFLDQCEKLFENSEENKYELWTALRSHISTMARIHYVFITSNDDSFELWWQNFQKVSTKEIKLRWYRVNQITKKDFNEFKKDLCGKLVILSYYWNGNVFPITPDEIIDVLLKKIFNMHNQGNKKILQIPFYYRLYLKFLFDLTKLYYTGELNFNILEYYKFPEKILKKWIEQFLKSLDSENQNLQKFLRIIVRKLVDQGFIKKSEFLNELTEADRKSVEKLLNLLIEELRFLGPRSANKISFQHDKLFELIREQILDLPPELKEAKKEFLVYHDRVRHYHNYPSKENFEELHTQINRHKEEIIDKQEERKTYVKLLIFFEKYEDARKLPWSLCYYDEILNEIENSDFDEITRDGLNNIDRLVKNLIKFGTEENLVKGATGKVILKIIRNLVSSSFFKAYLEFLSKISCFEEILEGKNELSEFGSIVEETLKLYRLRAEKRITKTQKDSDFVSLIDLDVIHSFIEQSSSIKFEPLKESFLKQSLILWLWLSKENKELNKIVSFINETSKLKCHVKEVLQLVWSDSDFVKSSEKEEFLNLLPIKFWIHLLQDIDRKKINLQEIIKKKTKKDDSQELFSILVFYRNFLKDNSDFELRIYRNLCENQKIFYKLLSENLELLDNLSENVKNQIKLMLEKTSMSLLKLLEELTISNDSKDYNLNLDKSVFFMTGLSPKDFISVLGKIDINATERFIKKICEMNGIKNNLHFDYSSIIKSQLFSLIYSDIKNTDIRLRFAKIFLDSFNIEKFSFIGLYFYDLDMKNNQKAILDAFAESLRLLKFDSEALCDALVNFEISKASKLLELYLNSIQILLNESISAKKLKMHLCKISSLFQRAPSFFEYKNLLQIAKNEIDLTRDEGEFNLPYEEDWPKLFEVLKLMVKRLISSFYYDKDAISDCLQCLLRSLKDVLYINKISAINNIMNIILLLLKGVMQSQLNNKQEVLRVFVDFNIKFLNLTLILNKNYSHAEEWIDILVNIVLSDFGDELFDLIKAPYDDNSINYYSVMYLAARIDKKRTMEMLNQLSSKDRYYMLDKATNCFIRDYLTEYKYVIINDIKENTNLFFNIIAEETAKSLTQNLPRQLKSLVKQIRFSSREKYELIKNFDFESLVIFHRFLTYIIEGIKDEVDIFFKLLKEKPYNDEKRPTILKGKGLPSNISRVLLKPLEKYSNSNPYSLLLDSILDKNKSLGNYIEKFITSKDDLNLRIDVLICYTIVMIEKDPERLLVFLIEAINDPEARDTDLYVVYLEWLSYAIEMIDDGLKMINKLYETPRLKEKIVNSLCLLLTTTKTFDVEPPTSSFESKNDMKKDENKSKEAETQMLSPKNEIYYPTKKLGGFLGTPSNEIIGNNNIEDNNSLKETCYPPDSYTLNNCINCPYNNRLLFGIRFLDIIRSLNEDIIRKVIIRILSETSTTNLLCQTSNLIALVYNYRTLSNTFLNTKYLRKIINIQMSNFFRYYNSNFMEAKASLCTAINFINVFYRLDNNETMSLLLKYLDKAITLLKLEFLNVDRSQLLSSNALKLNFNVSKNTNILYEFILILFFRIKIYCEISNEAKEKVYSVIFDYLETNDILKNRVGFELLKKILILSCHEQEIGIKILEITTKKEFFIEILEFFFKNGNAEIVEEYIHKNGLKDLEIKEIKQLMKLLYTYDYPFFTNI